MKNQNSGKEMKNEITKKVDKLIFEIRTYFEKNMLEKATKSAIKIRELSEVDNFLYGIAYYHLTIGIIYFKRNLYDKALDSFFSGLKYSNLQKDKHLQSVIYNNIGKNYAFLNNYKESFYYFFKALNIEPNNYQILNNIGLTYFHYGNYEKSSEYLEKAKKIVMKSNDLKEIIRTMINIGRNYEQTDLDKAMSVYQEALSLIKSQEVPELKSLLLFFISFINLKNNNYELAENNCRKSLDIATQEKDKSAMCNCYYQLSQIYESLNKKDEVITYLKKYITLKELIISEEMTKNVETIQKNYNEEKEELKIKNRLIEKQLQQIKSEYKDVFGIGNIGIFSDKMRAIIKTAESFHSNRNIPVLIEGETGTGKEIIARIIHYGKGEKVRPFIPINCAAISENLFESELFGYEAGAFTGANQKGKIGFFELANGGTIFLDEIGEMPLSLQPKLLRVLQEKEIYRIGGTTKIKLNIRIICATNRNLKNEIKKNTFRADLYYRLNIGQIKILPLRERKEEIPFFVKMFLAKYSKQKQIIDIDSEALEILKLYDWPGNVRELQNAIERVVLLTKESIISKNHFDFLNCVDENLLKNINSNDLTINLPLTGKNWDSIEKDIIEKLLGYFDGNQTRVAEYLGVSRYTILRKKKKLGIQ